MAENKKTTSDKADELAQIQERIFEREVDEELRQERLANFWKKYRFLIIGGAIGIILATIAGEWYGSWQDKIRASESDRLEKALISAAKGDDKPALSQLKQLAKDGKTGYRYIAKLEEAGLLFQKKKDDKALTILFELSQDTKAPQPLRDLALVSYVGHVLDTSNTEELKQMISPLAQNEKSAFYGQAVELMAWLHLISGEKAEAQKLVEQATASGNLAPQLKERLTLLLEQKAQ